MWCLTRNSNNSSSVRSFISRISVNEYVSSNVASDIIYYMERKESVRKSEDRS